jgi:hypothetical protein
VDFRSLFETCLRLFTLNQVVCWSLASRLGKNMAAIVLYIIDSLREKMLAILLEDGSIFDVGGSKLTKVRDLLVYVYDSDFEIDVEMSSEHILNHGEKSLSLKIRNPQLIPHTGIYRSVICVVCVHFVLFNLFILYFILQKLIQEPNY